MYVTNVVTFLHETETQVNLGSTGPVKLFVLNLYSD